VKIMTNRMFRTAACFAAFSLIALLGTPAAGRAAEQKKQGTMKYVPSTPLPRNNQVPTEPMQMRGKLPAALTCDGVDLTVGDIDVFSSGSAVYVRPVLINRCTGRTDQWVGIKIETNSPGDTGITVPVLAPGFGKGETPTAGAYGVPGTGGSRLRITVTVDWDDRIDEGSPAREANNSRTVYYDVP